ncbi:MAG: Fe2+-dependent dioxygenase [Pseudomonadota bacterium]
MFLTIPDFLTSSEVQTLRQLATQAQFDDGSTTTGEMPSDHKRNLQYVPRDGEMRTLTQLISNGVGRSRVVQDGALIRRMMPPMLSKYTEGMEYKSHLDSPFMQHNGPLRADLSMTLFLSDPESYGGGELVLETDFGNHEIKLPAGGAVIYSTRLYHHVTPVTQGERIAVITWMQSHIGDPARRKVIGQLWQSFDDMAEAKGETSEEARRLMHAVIELTRMWAES